MKLIYRGVTYDYEPGQRNAVERPRHSQAPYTLIYRGQVVDVDPRAFHVELSTLPAHYDLLYRGVSYRVSRTGQGLASAVGRPAGKVRVDRVPASRTQTEPAVPSLRRRYTELDQIHQANLLNNLQHRLQSAREKGDQVLIELLEAEQKQIAA